MYCVCKCIVLRIGARKLQQRALLAETAMRLNRAMLGVLGVAAVLHPEVSVKRKVELGQWAHRSVVARAALERRPPWRPVQRAARQRRGSAFCVEPQIRRHGTRSNLEVLVRR